MENKAKKFQLHVGMRSIKTAIAATVCALIYFLIGRNPTFACIGAIFGTGSDMENSWLNGGNRFYGTIIGGLLGMVLFRVYIIFHPEGFYPDIHLEPLMLLLLAIGVILLILFCQVFRWPGGIQPGGVVLCIILFNTPVATYVTYSLNRIVDTGIGVLVALLINLFFPREKVVHVMHKLHLKPTDEE
ncbi:MAG: aromatic acid exporter family protein [Clostridia bacterium]